MQAQNRGYVWIAGGAGADVRRDGGRVFEVSKKETVDKIYAEIGVELRSQYRMGFTPTADAASGGYHLINLTLTGPLAKQKTIVQTRDGSYKL